MLGALRARRRGRAVACKRRPNAREGDEERRRSEGARGARARPAAAAATVAVGVSVGRGGAGRAVVVVVVAAAAASPLRSRRSSPPPARRCCSTTRRRGPALRRDRGPRARGAADHDLVGRPAQQLNLGAPPLARLHRRRLRHTADVAGEAALDGDAGPDAAADAAPDGEPRPVA